ncbi:hypothetical protein LY76DRAFT_609262 [Colletotrichum caudatum]|nr:hypothetical protein LY76DRAFT_609262 [Colletotrichum caudatum]
MALCRFRTGSGTSRRPMPLQRDMAMGGNAGANGFWVGRCPAFRRRDRPALQLQSPDTLLLGNYAFESVSVDAEMAVLHGTSVPTGSVKAHATLSTFNRKGEPFGGL